MPQINFEIKPEGRSLGITASDLGRQIRHAFYGAEALRQPRGMDELRVMVKLPKPTRHSISGLEDLLVRTPDGGEIPLGQAAVVKRDTAPVRIERIDGAASSTSPPTLSPAPPAATRSSSPSRTTNFPLSSIATPDCATRSKESNANNATRSALSLGVSPRLCSPSTRSWPSLLRSYIQALVVLLHHPVEPRRRRRRTHRTWLRPQRLQPSSG